jgi:hypothetical protein
MNEETVRELVTTWLAEGRCTVEQGDEFIAKQIANDAAYEAELAKTRTLPDDPSKGARFYGQGENWDRYNAKRRYYKRYGSGR